MVSLDTWWIWLGFIGLLIIFICFDIFLLEGKNSAKKITIKKALLWSIIWFLSALLFNFCIWYYLWVSTHDLQLANTKAIEFFTGYLIEKSLAIDNIFVFIIIFQYFSIPAQYQKRVLTYGVLSAIVLRAILILFGAWLISNFSWILYIFGAFLIITGLKMFTAQDQQLNLADNPILLWLHKHIRLTESLQGERFFIKQGNYWFATPMFLALIFIELSDLIFAVDSIPAIFAITQDPFIVFSSNMFAILGLRALYFILADMHQRFHLLKYGLAIILMFIGSKMLLAHWYKLPIALTLTVVISIVALSIILSMRSSPAKKF